MHYATKFTICYSGNYCRGSGKQAAVFKIIFSEHKPASTVLLQPNWKKNNLDGKLDNFLD